MFTKKTLLVLTMAAGLCSLNCSETGSQEFRDAKTVQAQQSQYAKAQPVPAYGWSLERDLLIQLYNIRNQRVATHSVWRSDYGTVEGDCPSIGYGLPYDTSLTNPLAASGHLGRTGVVAIGQAEPNGVFASTNTAATWVMCAGEAGIISPVYIESHVTVYPWPMKVDYTTNRVVKAGAPSVVVNLNRTPAPTPTPTPTQAK